MLTNFNSRYPGLYQFLVKWYGTSGLAKIPGLSPCDQFSMSAKERHAEPAELDKGTKVVAMLGMFIVLLQLYEETPRVAVFGDAADGLYICDVANVYDYPYLCDAGDSMAMLTSSNEGVEAALIALGLAYDNIVFPGIAIPKGKIIVDTFRALSSGFDRAFFQYYRSGASAAASIQQDIDQGLYTLAELQDKASTIS